MGAFRPEIDPTVARKCGAKRLKASLIARLIIQSSFFRVPFFMASIVCLK
jgi:hypothetical protein